MRPRRGHRLSPRAGPEKSYTALLLQSGEDKVLKKVVEEAVEVALACKDRNDHIRYEAADLIYHLLVALEYHGVGIDELAGSSTPGASRRCFPEDFGAARCIGASTGFIHLTGARRHSSKLCGVRAAYVSRLFKATRRHSPEEVGTSMLAYPARRAHA